MLLKCTLKELSMPKIVDHDQYRRELLGKCFNLFSRKGYSKTTMREIAAEIGVSTGTLYHYFPTKKKILEEMFVYVQETNVGEYLRRGDGKDSIPELLEIISEFWKENESYYQNVLLLGLDLFRQNDGHDEEKVKNHEKVFADFSNYYTHAMADGLEVTPQFARSLFIYLLGLVFHSLLTPNHISYKKQISILRNTLDLLLSEGRSPSTATGKLTKAFLKRIVASQEKTPRKMRHASALPNSS